MCPFAVFPLFREGKLRGRKVDRADEETDCAYCCCVEDEELRREGQGDCAYATGTYIFLMTLCCLMVFFFSFNLDVCETGGG